MGILSRINRVIKSNVNELVDRMSDPAKEIDLLIIDMEKGLKEARDEVISASASSKRSAIEAGRIDEQVEKWHRRAEQAVRAGDDELAREALSQKMQLDSELASVQRAINEQESHVAALKSSLKQLESRLKDVKLRKNSLKQRARAAKDGQKGLKGAKAFDNFDRLEQKIEAMEEATDFSSSLDQRDAQVDAKFAQLEQSTARPEIEDELESLKRRLESGEK